MANVDTQARSTIAAYFSTYSAAEQAVRDLKEAGFSSSQIGLAANSGRGAVAGAESPTSNTKEAVGEKAEGTWSRIKNFFEGGDVEPYADERRKGELANREVTYYDTDEYGEQDVHGSFSDMSVPEEHSRYFGHRLSREAEGAVITVNANGREAEAQSILERNGGDVGGGASTYDYSQTNQTGASAEGTQRIQLLGEVLRVHKDRIQRGEVTIRKEVVTESQTVEVPVTREELVIERRSVEGTTPASGQIGDTGEIRIPLTEERPSVDKSTVVREEVSVGKRNVEDARTISEEVRHEDLVVDDQTKKR